MDHHEKRVVLSWTMSLIDLDKINIGTGIIPEQEINEPGH